MITTHKLTALLGHGPISCTGPTEEHHESSIKYRIPKQNQSYAPIPSTLPVGQAKACKKCRWCCMHDTLDAVVLAFLHQRRSPAQRKWPIPRMSSRMFVTCWISVGSGSNKCGCALAMACVCRGGRTFEGDGRGCVVFSPAEPAKNCSLANASLSADRPYAPLMRQYGVYRIEHLLRIFFFFIGICWPPLLPRRLSSALVSSGPRTAMSMAVSKISCTPVASFDEHSMYRAPIFCATVLPCSFVTGVRPCVLRSSMHVRLCRRSDLRPQRMRGVVGQKWRTSGYHFELSAW